MEHSELIAKVSCLSQGWAQLILVKVGTNCPLGKLLASSQQVVIEVQIRDCVLVPTHCQMAIAVFLKQAQHATAAPSNL